MTLGYSAQIKELILKLKREYKAGAKMFNVQAFPGGLIRVGYRILDQMDMVEESKFGELETSQAFKDVTEFIHSLKR